MPQTTKAFTLLEVVIALAVLGISWHCWWCGVTSVIQGGKFQSGFLSAGFSEFAGPHITNDLKLDGIGAGMAHAAVGGVASVLGGGKFENGAITSSFQYMYNRCLHGQCFGTAELTAQQEQKKYDTDWLYRRKEAFRDIFDGSPSDITSNQMSSSTRWSSSCPISDSLLKNSSNWERENPLGEIAFHTDMAVYKESRPAEGIIGSECSYVAGRLITDNRWAGTANMYSDDTFSHALFDPGGPKVIGPLYNMYWSIGKDASGSR